MSDLEPYRSSDFVWDGLRDQTDRTVVTINPDGTKHTTIFPKPRIRPATARERATRRFPPRAEVDRGIARSPREPVDFTATVLRVPPREDSTRQSQARTEPRTVLPKDPPRGAGFA